MYKVILLDWHGVLDKRTFRGMLETLASAWYPYTHKRPFEEYLKMLIQNFQEVGNDYASGKIPSSQFWGMLEYEGEESEVYKARDYLLTIEKNEELWSQLPQLREKYRLGILSDCPEDKTRRIKEKVDLSLFERTYFSS